MEVQADSARTRAGRSLLNVMHVRIITCEDALQHEELFFRHQIYTHLCMGISCNDGGDQTRPVCRDCY